jgi:hypothetical protein
MYQAILERNPAQIIPRGEQELAKLDPTSGYQAGRLRFWLGWLQELAGNHAAARKAGAGAKELESFLKSSGNRNSLELLALYEYGPRRQSCCLCFIGTS